MLHSTIHHASPRARGLTLVELAAVLALISILGTIAIKTYSGYRDKARVYQAASEINAMSLTLQRYYAEARAYPETLQEAKLGSPVDPWGKPYVYYNVDANGKGGARKDHALNPLNTDFDLYSSGADGASKPQITNKNSLDDVIRAGNGKFVGRAADF